jgi:demethylmenaquinone methyltransferase/2-methoxy-6-polyprenyl-1,4-benzoquinol methylase
MMVGLKQRESPDTSKAARVRSMFAEIAPWYDLLNHLLSLNIDRYWRSFATRKLSDVLSRPGARALDLCCGTADLALKLAERAETIGADFCHPMLVIGLEKLNSKQLPVTLVECDALCTPFADSSFDAVTIAFGLRNLEDITAGLAEVYRLLKPSGRAAILEFSQPIVPVFRQMFNFYFRRLLPRIGGCLSGSRSAYQYLPDSVKAFPDQLALANMIRSVGFSSVKYYNLCGGVAALHLADKAKDRAAL